MSSIDSLRAGVSDEHKIVVGPFKGHAKSGVHSSNGTNLPSFLTAHFNFYMNKELSQNPIYHIVHDRILGSS